MVGGDVPGEALLAEEVGQQLATPRDPDDVKEAQRFIQEARAALGDTLPPEFYLAAGNCLERHGQKAQALLLDEAIARRACVPACPVRAAWTARTAATFDLPLCTPTTATASGQPPGRGVALLVCRLKVSISSASIGRRR